MGVVKMSIEMIQVAILNHSSQVVEKFGRNSSALAHYQEGEQGQLINQLHRKWFGVAQSCIVAHHIATLNDEGEDVNYVVAVNPHYMSSQHQLTRSKGKELRYLFIFFESNQEKARQYVYRALRQTVMQNHPVKVDVSYKNVNFH